MSSTHHVAHEEQVPLTGLHAFDKTKATKGYMGFLLGHSTAEASLASVA